MYIGNPESISELYYYNSEVNAMQSYKDIGGVVSRPATVAAKNGSQFADRFTISALGETKKDSISAFSHFVKNTKTESKTLYTIILFSK